MSLTQFEWFFLPRNNSSTMKNVSILQPAPMMVRIRWVFFYFKNEKNPPPPTHTHTKQIINQLVFSDTCMAIIDISRIAQSDICSRHRYFGEKCRVPYWMLFWRIRTKVESQTESVYTELTWYSYTVAWRNLSLQIHLLYTQIQSSNFTTSYFLYWWSSTNLNMASTCL